MSMDRFSNDSRPMVCEPHEEGVEGAAKLGDKRRLSFHLICPMATKKTHEKRTLKALGRFLKA